MKKVLIAITIAEAVAVIAVLAGYLVAIRRRLEHVSGTLGKVTFGVRAIETQTRPIGPALSATNTSLEEVARRLESAGSDTPQS